MIDGLASANSIGENGKVEGLDLGLPDYPKLKLFFLTVLWRASASSMPFYRGVRLGPHVKRLEELVLAGEPGPPDEFAVVVSRFSESLGQAPLSPHRQRLAGVTAYAFHMGPVIAHVKSDSRRFAPGLQSLQLSPGRPLLIMLREFATSSEAKAIKRIMDVERGRLGRR